jgi:hypothetical protein
MTKTHRVAVVCLSGLFMASCNAKPAGQRAQEQLAALQKKRAEAAKVEKTKSELLEPLPTSMLKLDPPYDDAQVTVLLPDAPCPEGLWALFAGEAPGASPEEKQANQAKRAELAASFASRRFMVKVRGPAQLPLPPFDAPNGRFTIEVPGTIDCVDSLGRVALAWTEARPVDPGRATGELKQNVWQATPVRFELPMTSLTQAKEFTDKNRLGLSARIVFTLGKTEVDKKMKRPPKVTREVGDETLVIGGADEDWGAGRLVHTTLLGVRVATDRDRAMLFDQRPQ